MLIAEHILHDKTQRTSTQTHGIYNNYTEVKRENDKEIKRDKGPSSVTLQRQVNRSLQLTGPNCLLGFCSAMTSAVTLIWCSVFVGSRKAPTCCDEPASGTLHNPQTYVRIKGKVLVHYTYVYTSKKHKKLKLFN